MPSKPTTGEDREENIINLSIPLLPPSINHSHFNLPGGRRIKKPVTVKFLETVKRITKASKPLKGCLGVEYCFYVSSKRTDTENYLKVLTDSLQADSDQKKNKVLKGYCFRSDSQIDEIHAFRIKVPQGQEKVDIRIWCL